MIAVTAAQVFDVFLWVVIVGSCVLLVRDHRDDLRRRARRHRVSLVRKAEARMSDRWILDHQEPDDEE